MPEKELIKKCGICSEKYAIQRYEFVHDDPYSCGYYYQPCPNCGYNPEIESRVLETINENISVKINSRGKMRFNSKELSELVINRIKEYWPRNKPGKREK
jgi:hypothetical protein